MKCPVCGWSKRDDRLMTLTKHHVVPGREDGGKLQGNIAVLCKACHIIVDYPKDLSILLEISSAKDWSDAKGKKGKSEQQALQHIAAHKRIPRLLRNKQVMFKLNYYRAIIEAVELGLIKKESYLALEYIRKEID